MNDCKKRFQHSLATILGQVGMMRLESPQLEFYLKVIEEQVHLMWDTCDKCKRKGVNDVSDKQ